MRGKAFSPKTVCDYLSGELVGGTLILEKALSQDLPPNALAEETETQRYQTGDLPENTAPISVLGLLGQRAPH